MTEIIIKRVSPYQDDVAVMIDLSNQLMERLYPPESNHLDDANELDRANVYLIGAYSGYALLGIGAVKIMVDDGEYGEIKRVYVTRAARGKRLSLKIMDHLEAHMIAQNITIARLETGHLSAAALNLYKKHGYYEREPYGRYVLDPLSVFMQKDLCP